MKKYTGFKNMKKFVSFAIKKTVKLVHCCPVKYNIVPSIEEEIGFLYKRFGTQFRSNMGSSDRLSD